MGDARRFEGPPKPGPGRLKQGIQRALLAGGIAVGLGHGVAKPVEDRTHAADVGHKVYDSLTDPMGAGTKLLIKTADAMSGLRPKQYPNQKVEVVPIINREDEIVTLTFGNEREELKPGLFSRIEEQKQHLINIISPEDYGRLRQFDEETGKTIEQEIHDAAQAAKVPDVILSAVTIIESHGDKMAVPLKEVEDKSDGIDVEMHKGLTQASDTMAKKYNLVISEDSTDERFKASKILPMTALELRESFERFNGTKGENNDWGYAELEWNLGASDLYKILQIYLKENDIVSLDLPQNVTSLEDTDEARATATAVAQGLIEEYQRVIREKKITTGDLLTNPNVQSYLESVDRSDAVIYPERATAGAILYRDVQKLADK